MGNSLQDQLFKAGIANKKQAVRAKKAKNNKEKMQREGKAVADETKDAVQAAEQEKLEKDRELNRQKMEEANKKAIQAQIKDIVNLNRITERGDIEYRFTDNGKIKTLFLEEPHRAAIIRGGLVVVKLDEQYDIVPRLAGQKIAERNADVLLVCNDQSEEDKAIDDEYADYQIPDDLMW